MLAIQVRQPEYNQYFVEILKFKLLEPYLDLEL
jgi:hypothetical protein